MKNQILLLLLIHSLGPIFAIGQTDTIWYDSNWKQIDKKKAAYFRTATPQKNQGYWVVDHYISGTKQMEGLIRELNSEDYQGKVTWYYENGEVFQIVHYDEGVLNGKREVYHENGKLQSEAEYQGGKIHGKWAEYYDNGVQKESGSYEHGQKNGLWKAYYPNGKLKAEGVYVYDRKVEVWKTYFYDGSEQKS